MDEALIETGIASENIFDGNLLHVRRDTVKLPNGKTATREWIKHPGASSVIPMLEDGSVILVKQYRYPVGKITLEVPAGKLDAPGEDPLCCARRELEEETGLNADHWQLLSRVVTTPGFCTERISIFLARGLSQHEAHTDPDEFVRVKKVPFAEAVQDVLTGKLYDQKTALGILLAKAALETER